MRRYFLFLLILFPILSSITAAQNRSDNWTAWLRTGQHLILINSDGQTLAERNLPVIPSYDFYGCPELHRQGSAVAVSPDNKWMAYTIISNNRSYRPRLVLYDWLSDQVLHSIGYESLTPLSCGGIKFDNQSENLAFGCQDGESSWRIMVVSVLSGKVINQLDSHTHQIPMPLSSFPIIESYQNNVVKFRFFSNSSLHPPQGFAWNLITNSVNADIAYTSSNNDTFSPTGEVVNTSANCQDTVNPGIGVQVYDPVEKQRYTFAQLDTSVPCQYLFPHFVQNGERILLVPGTADQWDLLGRDGTLISTWKMPMRTLSLGSISGTPDGFIYTVYLFPVSSEVGRPIPAVFEVNTRHNQFEPGKLIWHLGLPAFRELPNGDPKFFEIFAVFSDAPVSAYIPWAQLAPPVYEPTPVPQEDLPPPTMLPTPEPLFQVGMTVTVQTTGGEILNLRTDHTRKAEVIMYLEDDMQLTLLEGPIETEGFTWWRIRTEDGIEGWTVENNGELQTLVPG